MRNIQLALLWLPVDKANEYWEKFIAKREEIRDAMGYISERRAKKYKGDILRTIELPDNRLIAQVRNDNGERFGVLQGVVMSDMPELRRIVPDYLKGRPYATFSAKDGRIVAGLVVPWTRVKAVARYYGKNVEAEQLKTPDDVKTALAAGEHVPVSGPDGAEWHLYQRKDGRIAIDGAKMADRQLVLRHGGAYSPVGNWWQAADLEKFLDRFPVKQAVGEIDATEEEPDTADSLSQDGGNEGHIGAPVRAKSKGPVLKDEPGIAKMPGYESSVLLEKLGEAGPLTNVPRPKDGMVRPIAFPEMVTLAEELASTPGVVKRFRTDGKMGEFRGEGRGEIRLHADLFTKGHEIELAATLAHEVGHLIDWLPSGSMKRGNLIGRLYSLHKFLRETYDTPGGRTVRDSTVRAELQRVSDQWRPWDRSTATERFRQYRESSKELYADAISVLLNDPQRLKEDAPTFYREFFAGIDSKPEVKDAYFRLLELLSGTPEELIQRRFDSLDAAYIQGDEKALDLQRQKIAEAQLQRKNLWQRFKAQFIDKHAWAYELAKGQTDLNPDDDPRYALEEYRYLGGKLKAWTEEHIQPIYHALEAQGIDWHQFGQALQLDRIVSGDRSEKANPHGYTPAVAQELLDALVDRLTPEQRFELRKSITAFRQAMAIVVDDAFEAGLFTREMYATMKKNPAYAAFRIIEHMDDTVGWQVRKQTGTLKATANVANATIEKMLSTIKATERQKVRVKAFTFLQNVSPESITQAEERKGPAGQTNLVEPRTHGYQLVTYYEQGRLRGKVVPDLVADSLNNASIGANNAVVQALASLNNHWFRPVFTTLNVGFQSVNAPRDFLRFWKNMPGMSFAKAIKRYHDAVPLAKVRTFGVGENPTKKDVQAKLDLVAAEKAGILGITYTGLMAGRTVEDTEIEDIMARMGVRDHGPTARTPVGLAWKKARTFLEDMGNFIETLPKAAAMYEMRGEGGIQSISAEERSHIRRKVGSPDFLAGGTYKPVTNEIFLFSNAIIQGMRSDVEMAMDPKTRAEFWWKTAAANIVPKLAIAAILFGLGDDDDKDGIWATVRKALRSVSEYDMTNYIPLPLGVDSKGNGVYVRLPQDETGRLIGGLTWKAIQAARGDRDMLQAAREVLSYMGGQVPSTAPILSAPGETYQYLTGQNVYDSFRNRFLFTDDELRAGGLRKLRKFVGYEFQALGGGIVWKFYAGEGRPRERTVGQKILEFPVASNVVGRWLKVTDAGEREQLRAADEPVKQQEARHRLAEKDAVTDAVKDLMGVPADKRTAAINQRARALANELYADAPVGKRHDQFQTIQKKLRMGVNRGSADPLSDSVMSAQSNAQKLAVIKSASQTMSRSDMQHWLMTATRQGVISPNVRRDALKDLR
jgi:hypothetical protein